MEYTENYHLPQWEATDRVLREDFNDAMSDIDDALKANADSVTELANRSRFTKLREVNIAANTTRVEIDLTEIDWSAWDKIHLDYLFTDNIAMWVYLNTTDEGNQFYSIGSNIPVGIYAPRLTFDVGFLESRQVQSNQNGDYGPVISYAQLNKIIFYGSNMTPGSHFVLWGEK